MNQRDAKVRLIDAAVLSMLSMNYVVFSVIISAGGDFGRIYGPDMFGIVNVSIMLLTQRVYVRLRRDVGSKRPSVDNWRYLLIGPCVVGVSLLGYGMYLVRPSYPAGVGMMVAGGVFMITLAWQFARTRGL